MTNRWIRMADRKPDEEGEILFISDKTEERIGIVVPEQNLVILSHTDLGFDEIDYWIPIPKEPK